MRKYLFLASAACLALAVGAAPAEAAASCAPHRVTHHHYHHVYRHHIRHYAHRHVGAGSDIIRVAQRELADLGYYGGKIDGIMGPQTREAIKNFQRANGLAVDGVVGPKTRAALAAADTASVAPPAATPMVYGDATVNPDFAPDLNGGTKTLTSRFAQVSVTETGSGADKRYTVTLNGQAILTADGQPSVIGMSQTFSLDDEDAIIFTSYSPSDTGCMYRTHVLVMASAGSKILEAGNCTHDYTARVDNNSLYITFPEHDDARAIGAVWRLEGMNLNRL